jgi:arsenate reductase (thioredoxin)
MNQEIDPKLLALTLSSADKLHKEYDGVYSPETVRLCLEESARSLIGAHVGDYIPIFAYRFARERLTAAAHNEGMLPKTMPEVLFVCVHNAGRSQIAAALLDARSAGSVHVRSAGSAPAGSINAVVVDAMSEIGIDISKEFPKPMTDDIVRAADVVVTMGCGDACPIYPGKRYEDWDVEDPAGKDLATVRKIRGDIERRVERLIDELVPGQAKRA